MTAITIDDIQANLMKITLGAFGASHDEQSAKITELTAERDALRAELASLKARVPHKCRPLYEGEVIEATDLTEYGSGDFRPVGRVAVGKMYEPDNGSRQAYHWPMFRPIATKPAPPPDPWKDVPVPEGYRVMTKGEQPRDSDRWQKIDGTVLDYCGLAGVYEAIDKMFRLLRPLWRTPTAADVGREIEVSNNNSAWCAGGALLAIVDHEYKYVVSLSSKPIGFWFARIVND